MGAEGGRERERGGGGARGVGDEGIIPEGDLGPSEKLNRSNRRNGPKVGIRDLWWWKPQSVGEKIRRQKAVRKRTKEISIEIHVSR